MTTQDFSAIWTEAQAAAEAAGAGFEMLTREQILVHLDEVADSWGFPRLSESARKNASLEKLTAVYKRTCAAGEKLGTWQQDQR
jgi:hypothetical protein